MKKLNLQTNTNLSKFTKGKKLNKTSKYPSNTFFLEIDPQETNSKNLDVSYAKMSKILRLLLVNSVMRQKLIETLKRKDKLPEDYEDTLEPGDFLNKSYLEVLNKFINKSKKITGK